MKVRKVHRRGGVATLRLGVSWGLRDVGSWWGWSGLGFWLGWRRGHERLFVVRISGFARVLYIGLVLYGGVLVLAWSITSGGFLLFRFFLFFLASTELAAGPLDIVVWIGLSFWVLWTREGSSVGAGWSGMVRVCGVLRGISAGCFLGDRVSGFLSVFCLLSWSDCVALCLCCPGFGAILGGSSVWFRVAVRRCSDLFLRLVGVHADLPCSAVTQGGVLVVGITLSEWG